LDAQGQFRLRHVCASAAYRHRTILGVAGKLPTIGDGAFVAPSAALIGDVQIGKGASIWYGTILRGMFPTPDYTRACILTEKHVRKMHTLPGLSKAGCLHVCSCSQRCPEGDESLSARHSARKTLCSTLQVTRWLFYFFSYLYFACLNNLDSQLDHPLEAEPALDQRVMARRGEV